MTFARSCVIIIPERGKENPINQKGRKKMIYNYYEVHEQEWEAWNEYTDWLNFEADMATNPYGD